MQTKTKATGSSPGIERNQGNWGKEEGKWKRGNVDERWSLREKQKKLL